MEHEMEHTITQPPSCPRCLTLSCSICPSDAAGGTVWLIQLTISLWRWRRALRREWVRGELRMSHCRVVPAVPHSTPISPVCLCVCVVLLRGQRISGGQRQRLAICRAFMRRPKVLLLDEATSALDAESESAVQLAIDNLIRLTRCTVLLVAHRLSTVMNADQICVIDSGSISERGTHDQLLQQHGLYYALVRRQLARKANLIEEEEQDQPSEQQQQQQQQQQVQGTTRAHYDSVDALIEQATRDKQRQLKQQQTEQKEDSEETKEG